jgi:hypothetical protein
MSRSSITLSIATWIRSARSGSSLMATIPRWLRGMRPKWMVSGRRVAPLGDPHRVHVTDEVADRGVRGRELLRVPLERCRQLTGRSSPSRAARRCDSAGDRVVRVLTELGAVDDRGPLVEQADEAAQQPGLALAALPEQHHVVPGEQRALELGDDGRAEPVQPGQGSSPAVSRPRRFSRISWRSDRSSWPLARSSPSVWMVGASLTPSR